MIITFHLHVIFISNLVVKMVKEKSRECHNQKPQPFLDTKRKRKPTNPNKHKSNKRTKSTKISSLFPKRGNRNAKRTEKYKNDLRLFCFVCFLFLVVSGKCCGL